MEWRKHKDARRVIGHLRGYGCKIDCIKTEEELATIACEVFGLEQCVYIPLVAEAISQQKSLNRMGCRRQAYDNIDRLWYILEPFWVETEYLSKRRASNFLK